MKACRLGVCLDPLTVKTKNKARGESVKKRMVHKEKVTPVLCLRGVTGL